MMRSDELKFKCATNLYVELFAVVRFGIRCACATDFELETDREKEMLKLRWIDRYHREKETKKKETRE